MAKKVVEHEDARVNKVIGESGFCSRREADQLILDGRVTINDELATLGSRVAEGDRVKIDGEPLYFIPMEMREYKLRRHVSSRRGALEENPQGEKSKSSRPVRRETRAENKFQKPVPSSDLRRERGEGRNKRATVYPDKKEGATRGKKVGEKSRVAKAGSRLGGPGRGKSVSMSKQLSTKGRKK